MCPTNTPANSAQTQTQHENSNNRPGTPQSSTRKTTLEAEPTDLSVDAKVVSKSQKHNGEKTKTSAHATTRVTFGVRQEKD